jgi:hypothetical protein
MEHPPDVIQHFDNRGCGFLCRVVQANRKLQLNPSAIFDGMAMTARRIWLVNS